MPRLASFAEHVPVRMIAVLNPARAVAPDRLNMRAGVFSESHIRVGRRDGKPVKASKLPGIADSPAIAPYIDESLTIAAAADGKIGNLNAPEWLARTTRRAETRLQ